MRRPTPPFAVLVLAVLSLAAGGFATAQPAPHRLVLVPFDAEASIPTLGLALPTALQRALNELDGVYAPPVGDTGVVLERLLRSGADGALDALADAFAATTLVLGRVAGGDALVLELVVRRDGTERSVRLEGATGDLPTLLRAAADGIVEAAGLTPANADRGAVAQVLGDVPSLPSLGPVAAAAARLPGVRLDQLETAVALDDGSAWVHAELARALALSGQTDRAVASAERAVELVPSAEAWAVLGVVRAAAGDTAAAAQAFDEALARNPQHGLALVGRAGTVTGAERAALLASAVAASPRQVDAQLALAALQPSATAALQSLRRAADQLPDSPSVLAALVDVTLSAGDPRGALALLQAAAARPLGATPAAYGTAERLPDAVAAEALAFVREGVARFPDVVDLKRLEADLLRRLDQPAAAEAVLRDLVAAAPGSLVDVRTLAQLLAERGAIDEAQALFATVADLDPDADVTAAQLDLTAGRARAALARLEPAVTAGTADALRRTLYGIALGRVGRIDEARQVLGDVLAEDPQADLAARALALLEEQGRLVEGAADLALEGEALASFERGLSALEAGEFVRAAEAFAAARAEGDAGILAFYEGYALQRAGDPRAAIVAYEAARADLGDQDVLLNNLGYAHLQLGRFDRALPTLQAAVAANPRNARAQLNLGLAYYGVRRYGEAVAAFDAALALDPALEAGLEATIADARRRAAP